MATLLCTFLLISLLLPAGRCAALTDEVVSGRKVQFITTIYPYSSERRASLKGEGKGIPKGIAVDPEGKLFAIFLDQMRIQVFNPEGRFRYEFGEKGEGEGRYLLPLDMEIAADGRVLLLDSRQQKVLIYDNKGRFLNEFSIVQGLSDKEQTVTATKMGLDRKKGIICIADNANSVIRRFTLEGKYLDKFGGFGSEEGHFSFPGQVAFDAQGNIYVLDMANTRVQVFEANKKFKFSFGNFGDSLGEFARPNAIVIDSRGRVYVLDRLIAAIQVFDPQGNVLGVIKDLDEADALRNSAPFDMAIDVEDRIYISAQDYHSIKVIKDME
ncbi:MAG: NHL repeat-containing protein [bacterium]